MSYSEVVGQSWYKQRCCAKAILLQVQSRETVALYIGKLLTEQSGRSTNRYKQWWRCNNIRD